MAQVTSTALKQDDITAIPARGQKADGAFRTISEVAEELNVPQHVLRFWETRFFQIRPLKRGGGRRYYRPEDVALLKRIHHLLYAEGYTIKGVQKLLKTTPKAQFLAGTNGAPDMASFMPSTPPANEHAAPVSAPAASDLTTAQRMALQSALDDLQAIRDELSGV